MKIDIGVDNKCGDFVTYMKDEAFNSQLHYISAISSFPISKMMELLPLSGNETIYESVNVLSSVDLSDLNRCIRSLYQRIIFSPLPKQSDANTDDSNNSNNANMQMETGKIKTDRHWICIEGIQTMFQYSQLKDPVEAHASLNDTMLRLRLLQNKCPSIEILFLLPPHEAPEFIQSLQEHDISRNNIPHRRQGKRFKRDNTGILIGDYIWKYYI
ncbi:Csm2p [Kluyveromyces lactis]|uniref:Chromosome segregation in meiosis protein 2 n=1 Tax=Kluyveromyces lactis (strain ATCC 8585 / CBS 2359 / DSM 70799 / NBRC 1267 / NRRL Y-1140 / WM37) TaxID=284590 RepID=CSM2_KLULA|nr:uncharacterized protein KLLA0_F04653g [Kluyveromyces lactis]Q6CL99.1 RecName: Full=Chromosome segregation in meiosis protein 2 [Kluyveromyces lactis NRRL Y-1140]CAG97998.1 KLLA0F04653p [Kluyveromyces lactis]|eukprot:XP_455290.1 uncharacterized protein KLLA0_F04653g [Kluyveromyces lactis]